MSVVRTVLIKFSKLWLEPEWLEQLRHTVPFKTCSFSSVSSTVFETRSALRESKDEDLASLPHEASEASIGQTKAKTMRPRVDLMPKMAMVERSKVRSKIDRDRGKMRSLLQAKHFSHAVVRLLAKKVNFHWSSTITSVAERLQVNLLFPPRSPRVSFSSRDTIVKQTCNLYVVSTCL